MHVGLDLLFLMPGATGGRETYARELTRALRETVPRLRMTTFVNAETAAAGPGWWSDSADRTVILGRVSIKRPAAWALGELVAVARAATDARVDVLHSPANFAPWAGGFTRVVTLHDLLFRRAPEHVAPLMRIGAETLLPRAARRAHRVITVSAASRDAIVADLGVSAAQIDVVPNGVTVPDSGGDAARARARLHLKRRPLVLSVATALAHKNLGSLLEGMASLTPSERPCLVLAGWGTEAMSDRVRAMGLDADVRALGAVSSAELEDLWAAASAAVTTTLHEGFGLPVLEAMARGVTVACSDLPVLREVAGEAAVWLDPRDPEAVARALRRVVGADPDLERKRAAGLQRALQYSWHGTAERTFQVYERAAREAHLAA